MLYDYIQGVKRTESAREPLHVTTNELGLSNRLLHSIVGMQTEMNEVLDAISLGNITGSLDTVNILEECGDLMWYLSIGVDDLNFIQIREYGLEPQGFDTEISKLRHNIGETLDLCKKTMFYGKLLDRSRIKEYFIQIFISLNNICLVLNSSLEEVMETNLNKLQKRYPEKFTLEHAENRDLGAERKILEGTK